MRVCSSCQRLVPADQRHCPEDGAETEGVQTLPPGTRVGAYRIVRMIGEGGMGFVFEATHEVLGRRSAIKLLHPELAADPGLVARFLQEAKAVNLIAHDHIVNVYDFSDGSDGAVYFVMEYLEGEPFDEYLSRRQRLEPEEFFRIFDQMLRALAAAHAKHIVHRDLKPANVFLVKRGDSRQVKLLDFGVAKLVADDAGQGLTAAGALIGTPHFMSPEQWQGKPVDARSDVFAVGIMMFQALTGRLPFDGRDLAELAAKVTQNDAPRLTDEAPDLERGAELEPLVSRALARRPDDRYQSIDELRADLERLAGSSPSAAVAAPESRRAGRPERSRRKPPIVWIAAALGIAALAAGGVVVATSRGGGSSEPAAAERADAAAPTIASRWRSGDRAGAVRLAHRDLAAALDSDERPRRDAALGALELVDAPALAPLLYRALEGDPELRARSARALAKLRLPDAAPRLRAALAGSPDRLRVDLAVALVASGDRDGVAILEGALRDAPAQRLEVAVALAELDGRDEAIAALRDTFETSPAGRARWREAARVLAGRGDAAARKALLGELSNKDPVRRLQAAWVLAGAGVAEGKSLLERAVADGDQAVRSTAALALADVGSAAAAAFIEPGLRSDEAVERARAAAVAARLGATGRADEVAAATDDDDINVSLTASAALVVLAQKSGVRDE